MGARWEPYTSYSLDLARSPSAKAMRQLMRDVGLPRLPAERLTRIGVPTTLIWGRQARANGVRVAEAASARHGWPLQVIEDCADDPARDQPEAFVRALHAAVATDRSGTGATTSSIGAWDIGRLSEPSAAGSAQP